MRHAAIFLLLLGLLLSSAARAADAAAMHGTAALITPVEGVDALSDLTVGVQVKLAPGWKTYWRSPGEAGLPPVFDWAGSDNLKSAAVLYPAPHRFSAFGLDNIGYDGAVTFPVRVALKTPGQSLRLRLKLDLLVCEKLCVPESHRLALDLPARAAVVAPNHAVIAAALARVPQAAASPAFSVSALAWEDGKDGQTFLRLRGASTIPASPQADVFIESEPALTAGRPAALTAPEGFDLRVSVKADAAARAGLSGRTATLTFVDGERAFEQHVTFPVMAEPVKTSGATGYGWGPRMFLIAFLGGLILNLMPCVLPVLSIKVLSVLKHGGQSNAHGIFLHFMATAAGILCSFWVLAAGLAALKSAGHAVGWGIQFQHPGFLLFLLAALLLFAANLWGWYNIPLPRFVARFVPHRAPHAPTLAGDFLSGALAAIMAMPCTAPFLGTAVGFALAGTTADIFGIFTCLGVGLATPYLLLALFPRALRALPKPGPWMTRLKKFLAVLLLVTAVWIGSVLASVLTQPTLDTGWVRFSESIIAPSVAEGKTVIVDVTADWCLTCKANKRLVLDQNDVAEALSAPNIVRLQADWTQRSEEIAAYLRRYGRYGVPFNIIYGPAAPDGIVLGEILTKRAVMDALSEAGGE